METAWLLGLPLQRPAFYILVFCTTLVQYNLHYRIKKTANPGSERFRWSQSHKHLHLAFMLTGLAGAAVALCFLSLRHFLALAAIGCVSLLYSLPLLPFRQRKRIKDFGLLKILVLSLVWTLITVWFPYVNVRSSFNTEFWLVFGRRFVFMFVLCLAFDIRDADTDRKDGIHTLPVMLSRRFCYRLIGVLLLLFLALSVWELRNGGGLLRFNAMLLSMLATWLIIGYSRKQDGDMLYLAGIDGMMLLQAVLVGIGTL
ncbi:hypothetical protein GCM10023143_21610 [Compostibacter hankyongensis]|uniref:UbiA prenyltransferase family protein n=2 Tax=Compostibacter hankyongensis TaxID=1007089 RepID=A0ABP8FW69_9BACT